eukprot:4685364-Amphidinium_carterae.1
MTVITLIAIIQLQESSSTALHATFHVLRLRMKTNDVLSLRYLPLVQVHAQRIDACVTDGEDGYARSPKKMPNSTHPPPIKFAASAKHEVASSATSILRPDHCIFMVMADHAVLASAEQLRV